MYSSLYIIVVNMLGLVAQNMLSLPKFVFKGSFSSLVNFKSNVLVYFAKKNVKSFCTAKGPHIFMANSGSVFGYNMSNDIFLFYSIP